jgi:hypothetical protein
VTEADLSRAIGRLEGRFDAFERTRIERDQAVDRQLAAIDGKLGRGGALVLVKIGSLLLLIVAAAGWLADRLPAWLR